MKMQRAEGPKARSQALRPESRSQVVISEVGLKRFSASLDRPMTLKLLPLQERAEIYFDHPPEFVEGVAASLRSVEAVVEYRFELGR